MSVCYKVIPELESHTHAKASYVYLINYKTSSVAFRYKYLNKLQGGQLHISAQAPLYIEL